MANIDDLITRFKEIKEELVKNGVNESCGSGEMNVAKDGGMDTMEMSEEVVKFDKNGQWKMEKSAFKTLQHKIEHEGHSKDSAAAITASIGRKAIGEKAMEARSKAAMSKDETSPHEGINRTSSPKEEAMRTQKVHMVKDEGVNSEPERHHDNFKVMPMTSEKESKKEKVSGKPYDGSDSKIHKGDHPATGTNDENKAPGRHSAFGI